MNLNKKLKRPESMDIRTEVGATAVETGEVAEFLTHCSSIALIITHIPNPYEADARIKRYFELTGAATDEI